MSINFVDKCRLCAQLTCAGMRLSSSQFMDFAFRSMQLTSYMYLARTFMPLYLYIDTQFSRLELMFKSEFIRLVLCYIQATVADPEASCPSPQSQ